MITCSQCGIRVDDGDDKCFNCGAPILTDVIHTILGSQVEKELSEANLLKTKGKFVEAISACAEILRNNPENAAAHALLGDIYFDQQNFREALGWYKLAVKLEPLNENYKKKVNGLADKIFGAEVSVSNKQKSSGWSKNPIMVSVDESPFVKAKKWILSLSPALIITITTILFAIIGGIVVFTLFKPPATSENNETPPPVTTETTGNQPPQPDAVINNNANKPPDNNMPTIVQPKPDVTENGDIPGLPGIKVDKNIPPATNTDQTPTPTPNPTPVNPPMGAGNNNLTPLPSDNGGNATPGQEVAPLKPSDYDIPKTDWKLMLNADLKTQANIGTIDRAVDKDGTITVEYHISDTSADLYSKRKVLFTTQWILFSLIQHNYAGNKIVLNCTAPDKVRKTRTTVFFTDLSKEQAKTAISAKDYGVFANSIGIIVWRDDFNGIRL
ncbi:MAG: tetratricopeptide repeat protein [bacterium]